MGVAGWSAWSPGVETPDAWRRWAAAPRPLEQSGAPDVKFVPAMLRRRCDPLARMMLQVAHEACPEAELARVPTVFASRHGSLETRVGMLYNLARGEAISPARFSHSVHNAQSGLFSIWTKNRAPSTSLTAGADTFAHGLLESVALLERGPFEGVLYVVGDQTIPDSMTWIAELPPGNNALALWLVREREGVDALELAFEPGSGTDRSEWPDAVRFAAWWVSAEPELRLDHGHLAWKLTR
ncbi:MAG: beta-ketoacyl synthase chain length factor [Myxococcota bacterium]